MCSTSSIRTGLKKPISEWKWRITTAIVGGTRGSLDAIDIKLKINQLRHLKVKEWGAGRCLAALLAHEVVRPGQI